MHMCSLYLIHIIFVTPHVRGYAACLAYRLQVVSIGISHQGGLELDVAGISVHQTYFTPGNHVYQY